MKLFVFVVLLGVVFLDMSVARNSSPKVQVYTRLPGEFGRQNTFICHVTDFHPPEIKIELLKNNQVIPKAEQTDLAFEDTWHYHLTKYVSVIPQEGDQLACKVTHMKNSKTYIWESDF